MSLKISESVREVLGYLNFSNGNSDAKFQKNLNDVFGTLPEPRRLAGLRAELELAIPQLRETLPAFSETGQAEAVIALVADVCLPAYREFHADLLFHLDDSHFEQPFFLARLFEAVLAQGGPWDETDRIVDGVLGTLNDFIGVRPVAVLDNDQKMQPYEHEYFRPVPLFLRDAGVAAGPYQELIQRTLDFFADVPEELQRDAYFDLSMMAELSMDVRAYDHLHPVNKRTNYMFGEWDPHTINTKGFYERFVLRKIILDALLSWIDSYDTVPMEERLHDAAAVLCGTMLMASSISGSGPGMHDSTISLTTLLPLIARQRDRFYAYLLDEAKGKRRDRLQEEAEKTQQPFGHVRKHLNVELSAYGAKQVHCRFLSQLFARMGSAEASQSQAVKIPSPAARFESEIGWRLTATLQHIGRGEIAESALLLQTIGELLDEGIGCGALADPWNVLAFQGQFPLFHTRDDSIPDQRIELLLDFMDQYFAVYSRAMSEAAAYGDAQLTDQLSEQFQQRAEWWDRFATSVVVDLPQVMGVEMWTSACAVADALKKWQQAGEAAGDISFWREHVEAFHSPAAYGRVVNTLLDKGDHIAAMGLLMQWLSEADDMGLEAGEYSFNMLIVRWAQHVADHSCLPKLSPQMAWSAMQRLFDYLEANAGELWSVPQLHSDGGMDDASPPREMPSSDELLDAGLMDNDSPENNLGTDEFDDEESNLFSAAYDDVVFHDSADDGNVGDTADEGFRPQTTEIEIIARQIEVRLGFLKTMGILWEITAKYLLANSPNSGPIDLGTVDAETVNTGRVKTKASSPKSDAPPVVDKTIVIGWLDRLQILERELGGLLLTVSEFSISLPSGNFESNYEYDVQLQAKYSLQYRIVDTILTCRKAGWWLHACFPTPHSSDGSQSEKSASASRSIAEFFAFVFRQDIVQIRRMLPNFLRWLAKKPLLYVPLESNGDPKRYLAIRTMQTMLRLLVDEVARLGLLDEVLQLLKTAHRMERTQRPSGVATTEFDQLFKIALKSSLSCIARSAAHRSNIIRPSVTSEIPPRSPRQRTSRNSSLRYSSQQRHRFSSAATNNFSQPRSPATGAGAVRRSPSTVPTTVPIMRKIDDETLIDNAHFLIDNYQRLWKTYSRSIRLSPVEALEQKELWEQVQRFTNEFGDDFFQTPMLMVSNIRSILQMGVSTFLEYLEKENDPLQPNRLISAIEDGDIELETASYYLEIIYECVLDKLERFIEYNTTTTQSDYGHLLYCLLDFLRVEAEYDRTAWVLKPYRFVHEALTESGRGVAALMWESVLRDQSQKKAKQYQRKLQKLEKQYGVRIPSLADHIDEQFVKPLSVNRMVALIAPSLIELQQATGSTPAFSLLRAEIQRYLETTSGSAIEVPVWLIQLDREAQRAEQQTMIASDETLNSFAARPPIALRPEQLEHRLKKQTVKRPVKRRKKRG